jgi:hypothetical protein
MALVQLTDAIIPAVYESYSAVNSVEKTAFFESGAAVRSALLDNATANGGKIIDIPFWKDLDTTIEPNYSTDATSDVAVPNKIQAGEMLARKAMMNQSYSAADLVEELAGSDPMRRIKSRFNHYWNVQLQKRALKSLMGVLLDNIATNSSDMTLNLAVEDSSLVTDANLFGRDAFVNAVATLGDAFGQIVAIAVHSIVFFRMVREDKIDFIPSSEPDPNLPLTVQGIPYYMGKRVIVDDGMPVVAGTTSGFKYYSFLMGPGIVGYGSNDPAVASEVRREPLQGNGGGVEIIIERKSWLVHPWGFKFTSNSVAALSPTYAELALATNWSRIVPERKQVPLAFLVTNG